MPRPQDSRKHWDAGPRGEASRLRHGLAVLAATEQVGDVRAGQAAQQQQRPGRECAWGGHPIDEVHTHEAASPIALGYVEAPPRETDVPDGVRAPASDVTQGSARRLAEVLPPEGFHGEPRRVERRMERDAKEPPERLEFLRAGGRDRDVSGPARRAIRPGVIGNHGPRLAPAIGTS